MSKIKEVNFNHGFISIVLESGVNGSIQISDEANKVKNEILGIEIFDQKSIDEKLKSISNDRNFVFSLSKLILRLGALESNRSIEEYIGSGKISDSKEDYVINIDDYFTITDIIEDVLKYKKNYNVILSGNDIIIKDLASGLGVKID